MRNAIALIALLSVFSCVAHAPFMPVTKPAAGLSNAQLYKGALRALTSAGLAAQTNDSGAGIVVSAWEETPTMGNDKVRYRWRIRVDAGQVRVDSDCQSWTDVPPLMSADGRKWIACEQQPSDRQPAANALASDVISEARTVSAEI